MSDDEFLTFRIEKLEALVKVQQQQIVTTTMTLCAVCADLEKTHPQFIPERSPLNEWWESQKEYDNKVEDIIRRANAGETLTNEEQALLDSII